MKFVPMKTIVVDNVKKDIMSKRYLTESPEKTHTKEEMDSLVRAIRYTQMFYQKESLEKMDEESPIVRTLPMI